jgi:hypothetical protein
MLSEIHSNQIRLLLEKGIPLLDLCSCLFVKLLLMSVWMIDNLRPNPGDPKLKIGEIMGDACKDMDMRSSSPLKFKFPNPHESLSEFT